MELALPRSAQAAGVAAVMLAAGGLVLVAASSASRSDATWPVAFAGVVGLAAAIGFRRASPAVRAMLAVAALHGVLLMLVRPLWPAIGHDALGYVAAGRWVAGVGEPAQHVGVSYAAGYGLLLALPYAAGIGPSEVMVAAALLNVAAGIALVLPLVLIVRETLGVRGVPAALAAAAGAIYAGVALQVGDAWPEVLLCAGFSTWVLVALRCARAPSGPRLLGLAAVALLLFALHRRTALLLPLTTVEAVIFASGRPAARKRVAAGFSAMLAVIALVLVFDHRVESALYPFGADDQPIQDLGSLPDPGTVGQILAGQLFSVMAGTLGLAALGGWALWRLAGRDLRRPTAYVALAVLGTALLGAAQLAAAMGQSGVAAEGMRQYVTYGRYLDPLVPALVALGIAALPRIGAFRAAVAGVGGVTAIAVVVMALGLTWSGIPSPNVAPGVAGLDVLAGPLPGDGLWAVGLVAVAGAALLAAWLRLVRAEPAALAVALLAVVTLAAAYGAFLPWRAGVDGESRALATVVRDLGRERTLAVVLTAGSGREPAAEATLHRLQFLDPDRRVLPLPDPRSLTGAGADLAFLPGGARPPAAVSPRRVMVMPDVTLWRLGPSR